MNFWQKIRDGCFMSGHLVALNHFNFFHFFDEIVNIFISPFDLSLIGNHFFLILLHINGILWTNCIDFCCQLPNSSLFFLLIILRSACKMLIVFLKIFLFPFYFFHFIIKQQNCLLRIFWVIFNYFSQFAFRSIAGITRKRIVHCTSHSGSVRKSSWVIHTIWSTIDWSIRGFGWERVLDGFWNMMLKFIKFFWSGIPFEFPFCYLVF